MELVCLRTYVGGKGAGVMSAYMSGCAGATKYVKERLPIEKDWHKYKKAWNWCSTSSVRGPEKPTKKDIDTHRPRRYGMKRWLSNLFSFEISQVSAHKSKAQRFIKHLILPKSALTSTQQNQNAVQSYNNFLIYANILKKKCKKSAFSSICPHFAAICPHYERGKVKKPDGIRQN